MKYNSRNDPTHERQVYAVLALGAVFLILLIVLLLLILLPPKTGASPAPAQTTGRTVPTSPEKGKDEPGETENAGSGTSAPGTGKETAPVTPTPETQPVVPAFELPEIYSRFACLAEADTGRILAAKNENEQTYCASITKIMTVLVALENLNSPEQSVTISYDLLNRLWKKNAAVAGFEAGEKVKAADLMYAALLPSGADGSVGLAELIAGSEDAFAVLMNRKAEQLGMKSSHFANATGLHDAEHYTTCADLVLLLREALKNETFREIFSTRSYVSSATNEHPSGLKMKSTMFKYLSDNKLERDYFVGGKTGYTSKAGVCLASVASIGGKEYILVTLGAGTGSNYPQYQITDAVKVFDALEEKLG